MPWQAKDAAQPNERWDLGVTIFAGTTLAASGSCWRRPHGAINFASEDFRSDNLLNASVGMNRI